MPELAEVEFFRRQWDVALGETVERVLTHPRARIFREVSAESVERSLTGATFRFSEAQAKQMLFRFNEDVWLGLHLGMSGQLIVAPPEMVPDRHDHLVIQTREHSLVFSDPRMFGKVDLHRGVSPPAWWVELPPPILSSGFTPEAVRAFCARRSKTPIKSVLLMQERFPGIGNWMADEVLWRAGIHPACPAGALVDDPKLEELYNALREVATDAMREIAGMGSSTIPEHLSDHVPDDWLFNHRWKEGGRCPRTGRKLVRELIGGRTTCYCPAVQQWGAPVEG